MDYHYTHGNGSSGGLGGAERSARGCHLMACILIGVFSFALVSISDILRAGTPGRGFGRSAARATAVAASLMALASPLALAAAIVVGILAEGRIGATAPLRIACAALSIPFIVLLAVSEFVEVRFVGRGAERVVDSGTYALCRHPGFWWFTAAAPLVACAADSADLLAAAPAWAAAEFLLVYAEDRWFFPAIFGPEYDAYKKRTPFLVPDRESARRFAEGVSRKPGGGR